jgi:L-Ala-D/L-Glu epimerase / N-acetyl-D-glutamate racemase
MTAYTLGVDTPDALARKALELAAYPLLKVKMTGEDDDLERVRKVRGARPNVELIVDANQSWNERQFEALVPQLSALGVRLIEQPLPAGQDDFLLGFESVIPLCADESCQTTSSLSEVAGRYEYANIKLDKTGGLTEALSLARTARTHGLGLMIGCMGGSSLSMAPAFIVGQLCDLVDLDGPLLAKSDVPHAIRYEGNQMMPPEAVLWG